MSENYNSRKRPFLDWRSNVLKSGTFWNLLHNCMHCVILSKMHSRGKYVTFKCSIKYSRSRVNIQFTWDIKGIDRKTNKITQGRQCGKSEIKILTRYKLLKLHSPPNQVFHNYKKKSIHVYFYQYCYPISNKTSWINKDMKKKTAADVQNSSSSVNMWQTGARTSASLFGLDLGCGTRRHSANSSFSLENLLLPL